MARLSIPTLTLFKQASAIGHAFPVASDESRAILEKEGQEPHAVLSQLVAHPSGSGLDDRLKIKVI
jgi:hypothetical protein